MKSLKVVLVDDNLPFRKAVTKLLQKEYKAEIIGEASNAEEFLSIRNLHMADIIFMDVMMPGMDGISLAKKTLWANPTFKIVAITMHIDKVYLISLVEAGFKGCINKTRLFEEINTAIQTVLEGNVFFPDYINLKE